LSVARETRDVADGDVDEIVGNWLRQRASYEKVERAATPGDLLKVTYHGQLREPGADLPAAAKFFMDAEDTWLALRPPELLPGSIAALTGAEAGSEHALNVTFPDDFAEKSLAGQSADYTIKVIEVHAAEIPELTDAMAKEVGADSVSDFRERIRRNLEADRGRQAERAIRDQLVETLLRQVPDFPLPPTVLARETYGVGSRLFDQEMRSGKTAEDVEASQKQLLERARELARERLKRMYVLRRIADAEDIKVERSELDATVESLSQYHRVSAKVMQRRLHESGRIADVLVNIQENKVIERLVALAHVEGIPAPAAKD
jgi:trigger factor